MYGYSLFCKPASDTCTKIDMFILSMLITMTPVIMAGVMNMLFCKTRLYKRLSFPIDGEIILWDKKRLFGENKTWGGFLGMIVSNAISQLLWGFVCLLFPGLCYIYAFYPNTPLVNLIAGALIGFSYVLFELPNSFIKRRLDIPCGKTVKGVKGGIFFVIDQIDSLFGVGLVFALLYPMPLWQYFLYILMGAIIHIGVNLILYKTGIRRNR